MSSEIGVLDGDRVEEQLPAVVHDLLQKAQHQAWHVVCESRGQDCLLLRRRDVRRFEKAPELLIARHRVGQRMNERPPPLHIFCLTSESEERLGVVDCYRRVAH